MDKSQKILYLFPLIYGGILVSSLLSESYQELVYTLLFTLLYSILYKLGKGIPLRETTAFFYVVTCLFFPMIGYEFYSYDHILARAFIKYMMVEDTVYFGTALPSIAAFSLVLTWPLSNKYNVSDNGRNFERIIGFIRTDKTDRQKIGIIIIVIGILMSLVAKVLPASLGFVVNLFYFSSFAGLLYLYFSKVTINKYLFIGLFLAFIIANALATGMFTIVAYMGITIFSFFFLGNKMRMWKKLAVVALGFIFIIVLQASKTAYREATWNSDFRGNKALLMAEIFVKNLTQIEGLFNSNEFFPLHSRMNQGWNISLVMKRIPSVQEHDGGKQLLNVVGASIVPRLFWPDKPMAGGKFNMKHYAGINIWGYSTNVGPLGEAYGSFGATGAIFFMALLAWFVRWVYQRVFILAIKTPLLICWIPVLFYQLTYSAETDTLQILNSILKGSFFIYVLYRVFPSWFGVMKQDAMHVKKKSPVNA